MRWEIACATLSDSLEIMVTDFLGLKPSKMKFMMRVKTTNMAKVKTVFSRPITKEVESTTTVSIMRKPAEVLIPKYLLRIITIMSAPAVVPPPRKTKPSPTPIMAPAIRGIIMEFSGIKPVEGRIFWKTEIHITDTIVR